MCFQTVLETFDNPLVVGRIHGGGKINVARLVANVGWFLVAPEAVREVHTCHAAPRDVCTPAPDTKFRHLYSIDIRLIAVDRLRVPRFGHRTVLLSLSLSLSFSLLPSCLFLSSFFFTKLTVISEISISSLLRMCWSCGPTRRARAVASRIQTSPSLSSRATTYPLSPVPLLSASPQGFCTPPRNVIFPPAASCWLPIFAEAIIAHRSSDCPFGPPPRPPRSVIPRYTSVVPRSLPTRSSGLVTETKK